MKFNPATQKFEPKLPTKKKGKKFKIKWSWKLISITIIGLILIFGVLFLAVYSSI